LIFLRVRIRGRRGWRGFRYSLVGYRIHAS
jgi:hypothetical protein